MKRWGSGARRARRLGLSGPGGARLGYARPRSCRRRRPTGGSPDWDREGSHMSDATFEHHASFERVQPEGNVRLGKLEAMYEELFAEVIEDGVITVEERQKLDKMADSLGCDKVATGHFARVEYDETLDRYRLFRGRNHWKDQSYFLWELTQDQLSRAYFPLGEMLKEEVRDIARDAKLYTAEKKESQEICFVPDGKYSEFIDRYLNHEGRTAELPAEGDIVNTAGKTVGTHTGIHRYTIGQRRGIGIANEKPLYVLQIESAKNQIIVGEDFELDTIEFHVKGVNWVAFDEQAEPVRAAVKVRYRHDPALATIHALPGNRARIVFDHPQRAITPGQATIFYDIETLEEVVGGGWIVRSL